MGLFNKGACPICQYEVGLLTKSNIKHGDDYICQKCLSKLLKAKVFITKIKDIPIDDLKKIVEDYDYNIEIRESENEKKYKDLERYSQAIVNKKKIKQVMVLNTVNDSKKSFSSSVVRGAVGNFALGPIGAIGGAISGKNKIASKTTFLIEYQDGHKETKIVDNNSKEYKELCKYIKF